MVSSFLVTKDPIVTATFCVHSTCHVFQCLWSSIDIHLLCISLMLATAQIEVSLLFPSKHWPLWNFIKPKAFLGVFLYCIFALLLLPAPMLLWCSSLCGVASVILLGSFSVELLLLLLGSFVHGIYYNNELSILESRGNQLGLLGKS